MGLPVAVQLYTVRDQTEKDFIGTLEKVAEIGYEGVEFAGFGDIPASRMKAELARLGLKSVGCHTGKDILRDRLDEVIAYNAEIGSKYVIIPWDRYETEEGWAEAVKFYESVARKCAGAGLRFGYHNHAHEFTKYNDVYALDIIYGKSDPGLVIAEIDTFWVYYAGEDPAGCVKKYAGRCPLVHVKDMEKGESRDFTEVGNGKIDIRGIIEAAREAGAEWLIVEQDSCKRPTLESIRISFENLKKLNP